jgi:glutamine synthetase
METKSLSGPTRGLKDFLLHYPSVKYIRLQWVDFSGVLHCRIITKAHGLQLNAGGDHYKVAHNCMTIPISISPECVPQDPEAWELVPDWDTLRICGFAPSHATVMCFTDSKNADKKFAKCPRYLLQDTVRLFHEQHATSVLIGFEVEFVLLDDSSNLTRPIDRIAGYSTTGGLRGDTLLIMEEIIEALEASHVAVYHFHTEVADQLEIAICPTTPLEAIDSLVYTQETIRTVCVRHGLKASLTPRPVINGPQNGCHIHLSLGPASQTDSFFAGILKKIKALCAFGMPNFDSYVRVMADGAGLWVGWGTENRDFPVRRISHDHWEFRFADATANFYLLLAVILMAGSNGIRQDELLNWKDCGIDPERVSSAKLAEYGILERLPTSLRESVDAAKCDKEIQEWIGDEILSLYVNIKEIEIETFAKMHDEERRRMFLNFF